MSKRKYFLVKYNNVFFECEFGSMKESISCCKESL